MDAQALATVFAPNILRPREDNVNTFFGENDASLKVILILLDNWKALNFNVLLTDY